MPLSDVLQKRGLEIGGPSPDVFGAGGVFPLYSPMIDSIKVVRRGQVRRAKLYYLRGRRGKSARITERQDHSAHNEAAAEAKAKAAK